MVIVFGVPLKQLIDRDKPKNGIPIVIQQTTNYLSNCKLSIHPFRLSICLFVSFLFVLSFILPLFIVFPLLLWMNEWMKAWMLKESFEYPLRVPNYNASNKYSIIEVDSPSIFVIPIHFLRYISPYLQIQRVRTYNRLSILTAILPMQLRVCSNSTLERYCHLHLHSTLL